MKRPFLYDPIKYPRDKGVTDRLGLPPRSVESLIAKELIRITYDEHGKGRYVITEWEKKENNL